MRRPQLIDLAIAAPILAVGVLEALSRDNTGRWLAAAVVNGAAVAFRRRSPLLALVAIVLGQVMAHDDTYETDPLSPFIAELLVLFTAAYQLALRQASLGLAIGLAYVWLDFASGREMEVQQAIAQCGFYVLAWSLGRLLHGHETRRAAAERDAAAAEEQARTAVADERARIARELHDAVAHSVSVMVLQAGGVRRLLGDDPTRAREREALAGVEETGRQAVVELHRMLGILRDRDRNPTHPAELAPQPSLTRVDALVDQVREAGLDATLRIEGEPAPLAPGLDMSAYRIVQEALTNALRYAPGARVDVSVRYGRDLQLEVRDDGPGHAASKGSGQGIVGMRERAALFGGELEAGPLPGGAGFRVHARLPA